MLGDQKVEAASQNVSFRQTLVVPVGGSVAVSRAWYVQSLPRQFVNARQLVGAVGATLVIDWAIRDSAVAGVPEWLWLQTVTLLPLPGNTPVNTLLSTGGVWLRFTLTGLPLDSADIAASAFL